jgi:mRNA interferase RelE/StbE
LRYCVTLTRSAGKSLAKLENPIQRRVASTIDELSDDPIRADAVKLSAADNLYRVRSGTYRVINRVNHSDLTLSVVRIGHRSEAHRKLVRRKPG